MHGLVQVVEDEIRFPKFGNSKIFLCHCQDENDKYKYQGAEIHCLLLDELTTFSESVYTFLRSRVRCVGLSIPDDFKGKVPRIVASSNPGGEGHLWVKRTFIDPHEPFTIWRTEPEEGGMLRQFIPARLEDNPSLQEEDPTYDARLSGLGTPEMVRAYRDGDWNIIQGAFFPEFTALNIVSPFSIPKDWPRIRAFDWGSRDPAHIVWIAISPEDFYLDEESPRALCRGYFNKLYSTSKRILPKHSRIIYRDWYIADSRDRGLKLSNIELAQGILDREMPDEKVLYGVAGRDIFRNMGGPSIAQQVNQVAGNLGRGALFNRLADNRRIPGWSEFRSRLIGVEGYPQLYVFSSCRDTIRLIPLLQADEKKPEDASQKNDHVAEAIRVGLMTFLNPKASPSTDGEVDYSQDWSLEALWKEHERKQM